jgi:aspartyl protease family protein
VSGLDPSDQARFFYLAIIGLAALAGVFAVYRGRLGVALQNALVWVLIFAGLLVAYTYRDRIGLALSTEGVETVDADTVRLRRGPDGHFHAQLLVNGIEIDFLVDTGASEIVLDPADAARAGFDPARLRFTETAQTANGTVRGAPVILDELRLGEITDRRVRAVVNEVPLSRSLLGMSYLGRFASLRIEGDTLTLSR